MSRLSKLSLLQLEDRTAPADFRWNPTIAGAHNWYGAGNWLIKDTDTGFWSDTRAWPVAGDDAVFDSVLDANGKAVLDAAAKPVSTVYCDVSTTTYVHSVWMGPSFTGGLYLAQNLYIHDPVNNGPFIAMLNGSARIGGDVVPGGGPAVNQGQLYLGGLGSKPASMNWLGGKLDHLTIHVSEDSTVDVSGSAPKDMGDTIFNVKGKLHWEWGNVTVSNPAVISAIDIHSGGEFAIEAISNSWGAGSTLRTTNHGLVRKRRFQKGVGS